MTPIRASVIVVSRERPGELKRCLAGLAQLDHPAFEVIVVADPGGLKAVADAGHAGRVKTVAFDVPNISRARNLGLAEAAGEVVAFIDDDAVPEPTWLARLTAPFADPELSAAGGHVRGRNGISFQSTGARVDGTGAERPAGLRGDDPAVLRGEPGDAIKTEGTNCAFRRETLCRLGGFDPGFAFYMDETDVNLRLAAARAKTAIVPRAQVHHGVAPSSRRAPSRLPRSLSDVGASSALLLRKHAAGTDPALIRDRLFAEQRRRLLRHMVAGSCEPRDVGRLLATLRAGWEDGLSRPLAPLGPLASDAPPFLPFAAEPPFRGMTVLAGRGWQAPRLRREAVRRVRAGERVTLFLFSPTALYHRVRFTPDGVWEQSGGLFGRSERSQPLFRAVGFRRRVEEETARVAPVRDIR